MKYLLATAALLALTSVTTADVRVNLPKKLIGEWCATEERNPDFAAVYNRGRCAHNREEPDRLTIRGNHINAGDVHCTYTTVSSKPNAWVIKVRCGKDYTFRQELSVVGGQLYVKDIKDE
jgi:hypothetical protein